MNYYREKLHVSHFWELQGERDMDQNWKMKLITHNNC